MRQLSLFDSENTGLAQAAGLTAVIRAAMNRMAAASPYSRQQIVERMNTVAQAAGVRMTQGRARTIHLDTLEKWLNPESGHSPSLVAVEVFMQALGGVEPLTAWLGLHGCSVMTEEDRIYCALARTTRERKQQAKREKALEAKLEEVLK